MSANAFKIKEIFRDIHHFGFYVKDIEDRIRLFCNVFSMEIERDTGPEALSSEYIYFINTVTGIKCSNARIVYLQGFGQRIELIQFMVRSKDSSIYIPLDINSNHICFSVSDIKTIYEYLISLGYKPISKPIPIPVGVNKAIIVVYFIDKDGNRFEFMQIN